jgi:hypothetical protein
MRWGSSGGMHHTLSIELGIGKAPGYRVNHAA